MKRFIVILLLLFGALSLQAQEQVTVVLKNGKMLKGKLLDALYKDFITIEYNALERENIHLSHVKGMYFGEYEAQKNQKIRERKPYFKREKGFFHLTEVQFMLGQAEDGSSFSNQTLVQTINGYSFTPWLMLGGGVGLDLYGDYYFTPVFASIRGTLTQRRAAPYYYLNAGWAHFWEPEDEWVIYDYVKGGYHLQAGLGYQFSFEKHALLFNLGYRLQDSQMRYSVNFWNWDGIQTNNFVTEKRLLRRVVFGLGFTL